MITRTGMLTVDDLVTEGIDTVLVATPDIQGRLVGRRVPAERFARIADHGVEISSSAWSWDIDQDFSLIENGSLALADVRKGIPDVLLRPDIRTLRRAAWLDSTAICLADPEDLRNGQPTSISPRVILKRQRALLEKQELFALMGTELEFYLFRNEPRALRLAGFAGLEPTTLTPSDFLTHEGNVYEPFFRKLRRDLAASGIEVEAALSEWGTGQWEMPFAYGDPLEIADRHAIYKLAVRDSAVAAGLSVTFMAKPLNEQPGSSCHVHVSLVDSEGRPVFWTEDEKGPMSPTMLHAIGGVLEHTPELMAWYAPNVNSYRRIRSREVAGFGRTWGIDNRTVSVRVVGRNASTLRFEYRLPGADTNAYLALSGLVASISDGISRGIVPGEITRGNAYDGEPDEVMPWDLSSAAALFGSSSFVRDLIGLQDQSHFKALADHEWSTFHSTVSEWDLQRYFDRI